LEPEGALLSSQESIIVPYPELVESIPYHAILLYRQKKKNSGSFILFQGIYVVGIGETGNSREFLWRKQPLGRAGKDWENNSAEVAQNRAKWWTWYWWCWIFGFYYRQKNLGFFYFFLCGGTLGTAAIYWPIVPAPDDR
jgi:hypothetical protein